MSKEVKEEILNGIRSAYNDIAIKKKDRSISPLILNSLAVSFYENFEKKLYATHGDNHRLDGQFIQGHINLLSSNYEFGYAAVIQAHTKNDFKLTNLGFALQIYGHLPESNYRQRT